MAYTKLALKRDPNAPAGHPAAMYLDCKCGQQVLVTAETNPCACGAIYDRRGWVITPSAASHTETAAQYALTIRNGVPICPPAPTKLTCPYCNYDGEKPTEHDGTFRYLADVTTWREIIRLKKDEPNPTLIIEGLSNKYDEDEEKNERLECRACLSEFPIPAGLTTDFL